MTERKLIIFDFDGTLVEFMPGYLAALEEGSKMRGLPFDPVKIAQNYTHPDKQDLGWGIPLNEQKNLIDLMNKSYCDELTNHNRFMPIIYPDVINSLIKLQQEHDLAVVTARNRESFLYILDHYNMNGLFVTHRTLCCAEDRGYPMKPAPDAVLCVMNETGHNAENTIVIGDTSADIQMAHGAGVRSIAALWDAASVEKVMQANPTMALDKPKDLPQGIKAAFSLDY